MGYAMGTPPDKCWRCGCTQWKVTGPPFLKRCVKCLLAWGLAV